MPNEKMKPPVNPLTPGGEDTPTKPKQEPKDKERVNELLESMMYSPTSSDADAMIELDETTDEDIRDTDEHPEAQELLKLLEKGEGEVSEKYKEELLEKAMKDPTSIEVKTPRGWMTVKDAIGEGFDLNTGDFTNEAIPPVDWEGEISKLDPREQETIRKLTQPGRRQAGPSKAEPPVEGEALPPEGLPEGEPLPEDESLPPEGAAIPLGGV